MLSKENALITPILVTSLGMRHARLVSFWLICGFQISFGYHLFGQDTGSTMWPAQLTLQIQLNLVTNFQHFKIEYRINLDCSLLKLQACSKSSQLSPAVAPSFQVSKLNQLTKQFSSRLPQIAETSQQNQVTNKPAYDIINRLSWPNYEISTTSLKSSAADDESCSCLKLVLQTPSEAALTNITQCNSWRKQACSRTYNTPSWQGSNLMKSYIPWSSSESPSLTLWIVVKPTQLWKYTQMIYFKFELIVKPKNSFCSNFFCPATTSTWSN